jgi:ankyrin repeat protein
MAERFRHWQPRRRTLWLGALAATVFGLAEAGSYEDFFTAVLRDDADTVRRLLQRGFDPNTPNPEGETALLIAIREGSRQVVELLLDVPGVDVERRNRHDESPLMLAAIKGERAWVQRLIARDADVNKPGWTPLHYAASRGHVEIMQMLLDEHAYIDAASPNGTTPLMMAARYGTPAAVKLLLEEGADPSLKNDLGLTAIDFAQMAKNAESAELIAAFIRARRPKGEW